MNSQNLIHVAGTKGKGSTCAFVESILRHSMHPRTQNPIKTGLYTSPHLIQVRERIRINGAPLSQDMFAKYFFEVYDRLKQTQVVGSNTGGMPTYFRFLTLMAFHVFHREQVDVGVIEVGIGGTYDSTNSIDRPVVCGISSLGYDHQALLGNTLDKIAWQKTGIFKRGVPAVSLKQEDEAMQVVYERAVELGAPLMVAPALSEFKGMTTDVLDKLGLAGEHQRLNASLAVALCRIWMNQLSAPVSLNPGLNDELSTRVRHTLLPRSFMEGLIKARWPGRAQVLTIDQSTYYLDGAHTIESLTACTKWFQQTQAHCQNNTTRRVLIFNCTMGRDPNILLKPIVSQHSDQRFDQVLFVRNHAFKPILGSGDASDLVNNMVGSDSEVKAQEKLLKTWSELVPSGPQGLLFGSVQEGIEYIRQMHPGEHASILVTGSLHLIGNTLTYLNQPVQ